MTKKEQRHKIYDWLKAEGFDMTEKRIGTLSTMLKDYERISNEGRIEALKNLEKKIISLESKPVISVTTKKITGNITPEDAPRSAFDIPNKFKKVKFNLDKN